MGPQVTIDPETGEIVIDQQARPHQLIHSFRWPLERGSAHHHHPPVVFFFFSSQSLLVNTTQRDESVNYSYTYEDQESKNTNFQRHRRKNQRNKWTREQTDAFYNVHISRYHSLCFVVVVGRSCS
jgi:hypothetical protein